jgi:cholesterol transport system auxiliary component
MRPLLLLPLLAAAFATSGCIRLLPKPPPPPLIYSLEAAPATAPTSSAAPKNVVVAVGTPDAARALAGDELAWRKDGALNYVDGVTWEGRNLELLQTLLTRTIDRSNEVRGAVRIGEGNSNVELRWDLNTFEVEEAGDLNAHMQVSAKLFESRTRRLIATREFEERAPLADRSSGSAARALQAAARQVAAKITDWNGQEAPEQDLLPPPGAPVPAPSVPPPTLPR